MGAEFRSTLLAGYVLAIVVLAVGFLEGGTSGPCAGSTQFVKDNPGAAQFRAERQLFPPGHRCVGTSWDGSRVAAGRWFPEREAYLVAAAVFLVPFAFWGAGRLRPSVSDVH